MLFRVYACFFALMFKGIKFAFFNALVPASADKLIHFSSIVVLQ